jgi:hypothetical protein
VQAGMGLRRHQPLPFRAARANEQTPRAQQAVRFAKR